MSNIVDFASAFETAIEAGQSVVEGNVVKIIADNGTEIGNATLKVVQGGNGVASNVYSMTGEVSGGVATTTGVSFLTLDLGIAGAAVAPALGVVAGVGLYNIAPEFWTNVSNALVDAGKTVGGKVLAYFNGENVFMDEYVLDIISQEMIKAGVFDYKVSDSALHDENYVGVYTSINSGPYPVRWYQGGTVFPYATFRVSGDVVCTVFDMGDTLRRVIVASTQPFLFDLRSSMEKDPPLPTPTQSPNYVEVYGRPVYYMTFETSSIEHIDPNPTGPPSVLHPIDPSSFGYFNTNDVKYIAYYLLYDSLDNPNLQPGATYPQPNVEFPLNYPDWYPLNYPTGAPGGLPNIYPIKYPGINPDPYPQQDPAQNPDPESIPDIYPKIIPDLPMPDPTPDPGVEPDPDPEPDPSEDPDPIPDPDTGNPDPDPVDPNPNPSPSPIIPDPVLPDTVSSNKLFTVYNPSSSELDSLGGYLWDGSLMETLKKIWQNPLDGIISLIQVYATPVTSGSHNIILGYLDSGVSAPIVSSQFVTVDCGSINIREKKKNATDYSPFVSLHVYLPFIGIVELDINEFMNGTMSIKYKVDVYTGTCIAEIKSTRTKDMPNGNKIYEFSGNCSQQIPLTSGNATGALSAIISGVGAGLTIASGGALGVAAGASMLGHSISHEMFHVSHSGNLSANAGILGNRKPFVILGRSQSYDANGYNTIYGFPSNKTVALGNCTGFIRVKAGHLKTTATQPEYEEIMSLLRSGVIM